MPRGASLTAEAVCFFRAVETRRPPEGRLLIDPYAEHLLPRAWRPFVASPLVQLGLRGHLLLSPGSLQSFVAARHRWIDDALFDFLAAGGEQVVILGAGYDSRGLRFADVLAGRPLFEVDFPATQKKKRALVAERVPHARNASTYLSIDFEKMSLEEGLVAGQVSAPVGMTPQRFEPGKLTFFIWEGVAMYLHPETVDATLATVRKLSAPDSELVADMWSQPSDTTFDARMRRAGARMLGTIGEPIRFALSPPEAPSFFSERGYTPVEVLDSAALEERYATGKRRLFPDNSVVRVRVA